jgi:hypothetical protein
VLRALAAAFVLALSFEAAAKCAPKNVLKIVFAYEAPEMPADSFGAKPRTLYRLGDKLGRMEEMPNPETGLHLLVVVNGEDIWMVNRNDRAGEHSIDPGPSIGFHAPVISSVDSEYWRDFEMGCEIAFMTAAGATVSETPAGKVYEHSKENITARLFTDKSGIPARVQFSGAGNDFAVVYKSFEEVPDAPRDLFAKPAGVTFTERTQ